jgi:cyclophilin family peptidyl-prolyl cis-trans isomerase
VGGLLVVAWACGGPGVQTREPPHRPSDGLLADPGLQAVVADQVRRDGGALIGRLSDPRPAVRARAAFALGSVQAPEALGPLVAAIADSAAAVRRDVAFALGQLGAAEAVAPLADAFARETDDGVRARILEAFGKIGTVGSADALMGADIRGGLEAERTLALAVLGAVRMVRTPAGEEHLLTCLDDPLPRVREAAAYYFGRVPTPEAWAGHATRIREALDGYARDDPAAMYLVQALGRLDDPFDGERLRAWATSARDWRIRANAMTAIGGPQLGPEDRAVLHAGLGDRSAHVALAAALTLARTGVGPDEERRIEAWIDGHPDRWQVIDPLLSLLARSGRADYVLGWIDALPPDDTVRAGVGLRALGVLPGDAARERLARVAASESPRLAADAVGALARRWSASPDSTARSSYLGVFSRALRSGSVRAAYEAAPALADPAFVALGGADTLAAAYASMSTPRDLEAMQALLAALGATGSPRAAPILQAASNHGDPAIRRAAAEALASLSGQGAPGSSVSRGAAGDAVGGDPSPGTPALDWGYLSGLGAAPRLVLETARGRVVVRMEPEEAPQTVQTIATLAEAGRYDGVPFHRVVPNFVVQGGDFASGDGFGGPGFTIRSEFTLVPYLRGVIGMASAGKDTEGSQFFITHSMQPHLDGGYTSFGWVVEGMDVVDRLLVGDRIERATVERRD